jgi:4-hydroxy-L-threonine phosphate dehydrogenase PdxA
MIKKILIISGDPTSINSEIIYKSWKKLKKPLKKRIYLVSNFDLLQQQFKRLNYKINLVKVKNIFENESDNRLKIINLNIKFKNPFQIPKKSSSKFIIDSLDYAHQLSLNNYVVGFINCPIDKNLLNKTKAGVTELLAKKCKVKNNSEVMLISNKKLSVCPITTHVDIKDVSKKISKSIIINKVKTIDSWFRRRFKRKPKICILGLNPHNAELRKKSEENKIIIPAIKKLKALGVNLKGPSAADTIFVDDYNKFDVIVGMFHDQVLAPYKTLFKFDAINITLGLKYLRVSPDHGVAKNLIGKNKADETSLLKCIDFVNKFKK